MTSSVISKNVADEMYKWFVLLILAGSLKHTSLLIQTLRILKEKTKNKAKAKYVQLNLVPENRSIVYSGHGMNIFFYYHVIPS